MKCLKCRKEYATIKFYCKECEEKRLYKQRLDKVLSKFVDFGCEVAYRKRGIHIRYLDTFYLITKIGTHTKLELDTMEFIIRDMEAVKDVD